MSASKVRGRFLGKTEDSKLSKAVYCLAPMHDNIVNAILKIMDDDGPRPMKNMRPAQKQHTGAERFEIEHHGEYEARAQQSQNKVDRVAKHNMAYPKMYDELDRKRSMARPVAFTANRKLSPVYCVCKQIKNKPQKNSNRRNKSRKNTKAQKGPGINKPKQKIKQRQRSAASFRFCRIRTHKGCQCSYQKKLVEKCVSTLNNYGSVQAIKMTANDFERQSESNQENQTSKKQNPLRVLSISSIKKEPKSDIDSQVHETSIPSVTSYNSYLSMDHEPMVE